MEFALKVDMSAFRKGMKGISERQLPFATSMALTAVAGHAGLAWQDEMKGELDRPTPFTVNSVAVRGARKSDLTATVFVKDIAAAYLAPFVDGGKHALGAKKGLLGPKNVPLNAYGNLSKAKLAQLKAKPNVFVGPVKLKSGQVVNGVWQRNDYARQKRRKGGYGTVGSHNVKHNEAMGLGGFNNRTTLKLLIRFSDPLDVKQHLDFQGRTLKAVQDHFQPEFAKAFAKAMASAR